MKWLQDSLYCHHSLYHLGDGMLKCSHCKKKQSPERINKVLTLISCFTHDETALSVSNRLRLSYVSVHNYYETFRQLSAMICETQYEAIRHLNCEYEEYFYLEQSKRRQKTAIFDAHNFLSFDYEGHLYNIIMPSLQQYRQQFIDDNLEDVYNSEFIRFKRKSRIIKVSKRYNNIVKFWDYFERSIVRYKGVSNDTFAFYLKEIEFKFNHNKSRQQELLQEAYFERKGL